MTTVYHDLMKEINKLRAEKQLLSQELGYFQDRCADLEETINDAMVILNGGELKWTTQQD